MLCTLANFPCYSWLPLVHLDCGMFLWHVYDLVSSHYYSKYCTWTMECVYRMCLLSREPHAILDDPLVLLDCRMSPWHVSSLARHMNCGMCPCCVLSLCPWYSWLPLVHMHCGMFPGYVCTLMSSPYVIREDPLVHMDCEMFFYWSELSVLFNDAALVHLDLAMFLKLS